MRYTNPRTLLFLPTGIMRNPWEIRGYGNKRCGNPAEMEINLAGIPHGLKKVSVAGRILDDRRNQLNPDAADGLLLFLNGLKYWA